MERIFLLTLCFCGTTFAIRLHSVQAPVWGCPPIGGFGSLGGYPNSNPVPSHSLCPPTWDLAAKISQYAAQIALVTMFKSFKPITLQATCGSYSGTAVVTADTVPFSTLALGNQFYIDEAAQTLTVQPAVRNCDIRRALNKANLQWIAIAFQGQTIIGATMTNSHGTGYPSFPNYVNRMFVVNGKGEPKIINRGDPNFGAWVVSIGALGVVLEMEVRLMPVMYIKIKNFVEAVGCDDSIKRMFEGNEWGQLHIDSPHTGGGCSYAQATKTTGPALCLGDNEKFIQCPEMTTFHNTCGDIPRLPFMSQLPEIFPGANLNIPTGLVGRYFDYAWMNPYHEPKAPSSERCPKIEQELAVLWLYDVTGDAAEHILNVSLYAFNFMFSRKDHKRGMEILFKEWVAQGVSGFVLKGRNVKRDLIDIPLSVFSESDMIVYEAFTPPKPLPATKVGMANVFTEAFKQWHAAGLHAVAHIGKDRIQPFWSEEELNCFKEVAKVEDPDGKFHNSLYEFLLTRDARKGQKANSRWRGCAASKTTA